MYSDRDMLNQSGRTPPITPGMVVYDVNGDKVGSVQELNPQASCIVVEKGFIFTRDLYIPLSDISGSSNNDLYLNISKDDLKGDKYMAPPPGYTAGATIQPDVAERGNQGR